VLSDDGDAEGLPVLDQQLSVAVEDDPARRPQREQPLMVVFGKFLELRVPDDLQHPEAHGKRREHHRDEVLQHGEANADAPPFFNECHSSLPAQAAAAHPPPFNRSRQKVSHLKRQDADYCVSEGLTRHRRVGGAELPKAQEFVKSHEYKGMQHRRSEEYDKTGKRLRHDELRPDNTRHKPDERFGEAADANHPRGQRILHQAGEGPGQQAGH
jgi:hypothetical protein